MTPTIINHERPPNMAKIAAVYPNAMGENTIFAYGDKIYVPNGADLSPSLIAHETVHCERQCRMEGGPEEWWYYYLHDKDFMFNEELLAHAAEYKFFLDLNAPRNVRRHTMKMIAGRLSGPLYNRCISHNEAVLKIKELATTPQEK